MTVYLPPETPAPPAGPPVDTPTAAERLYERLGPVATYDAENGYVVQYIAEALALPQAVVDEVMVDGDQLAWQPALDPDTCPADWLPWLAQFPGVTLLPSDLTEAQRRARIKAAAGFYRGTQRAMIGAVQATLSAPDAPVTILTNVGDDRWALEVITRTADTPDPAASERAARSQKPGGFLLTYVVSDSPIVDTGTLAVDAATGTVEDATTDDVT